LALALAENADRQRSLEDVVWLRRIGQYGRFSPEGNQFLMDLSIVSQAADGAETAWIILVTPKRQRTLFSMGLPDQSETLKWGFQEGVDVGKVGIGVEIGHWCIPVGVSFGEGCHGEGIRSTKSD
jgi:hypothetical protein